MKRLMVILVASATALAGCAQLTEDLDEVTEDEPRELTVDGETRDGTVNADAPREVFTLNATNVTDDTERVRVAMDVEPSGEAALALAAWDAEAESVLDMNATILVDSATVVIEIDLTQGRDVEIVVAAIAGEADFTIRATSVTTGAPPAEEPTDEAPVGNETQPAANETEPTVNETEPATNETAPATNETEPENVTTNETQTEV